MNAVLVVAVLLLVTAAIMLVAGVGAPALWFAVVAVGVALVVVGRRPSNKAH